MRKYTVATATKLSFLSEIFGSNSEIILKVFKKLLIKRI